MGGRDDKGLGTMLWQTVSENGRIWASLFVILATMYLSSNQRLKAKSNTWCSKKVSIVIRIWVYYCSNIVKNKCRFKTFIFASFEDLAYLQV